ncbi:MAG: hypothetical protein GY909_15465 [Oligoflexia bacterium]|nr:hypothetical protein [Oligoflexia bacterium]
MKGPNKLEEIHTDKIFTHLDIMDITKSPSNGRTYIFNNDGSVSKILRISGINATGLSSQKRLGIVKQIQNLINNISGEDITIHHIQKRRKYNFNNKKFYKMPNRESVERLEFLKKLATSGEVLEDDLYICVNCITTYEAPSLKDTLERFSEVVISKFRDVPPKKTITKYYKKFGAVVTRVDSVVNTIEALFSDTMGVRVEDLDSREKMISLLRSMIVSEKRSGKFSISSDSSESIRKQLYSGITMRTLGPDWVELDGKFIRTYQLDRLSPDVISKPEHLDGIVSMPHEFNFHVVYRKITHEKAKKKFRRELLKSRSLESNDGDDYIEQNNTNRIRNAYKAWADSGEEGVELSLYFTIILDMELVKNKCRESVITYNEFLKNLDEKLHFKYFGKLAQSEWRAIERGQEIMFNKLLPGQARMSNLFLSGSIEIPYNTAHLVPIYNATRADIEHMGINHFFSTANTLVPFEQYDPELAASITLMSGDMGSGKSVVMNTMQAIELKSSIISGKNPLIRVIDFAGTQGSFYKRCESFKKHGTSEMFQFHKAKKPSIAILRLHELNSSPKKSLIDELVELLRSSEIETDKRQALRKINEYYRTLQDIDSESKENFGDKFKESTFESIFGVRSDLIVDDNKIVDYFELRPGNSRPNAEWLKNIVDTFGIMLSDATTSEEMDFNAYRRHFSRDDIEELILNSYEQFDDRYPVISDIVDMIKSVASSSTFREIGGEEVGGMDEETTKLLKRLEKWTIDGDYPFFDCEEGVNINSDYIVFDLFNLDRDPKLMAIYSIFLIDIILEDMYKNSSRTRSVYIDEAGIGLQNESIRKVVVRFCRLSRKYGFNVTLGTQHMGDYSRYDADDGEIIMSQAKRLIVCGVNNHKDVERTSQMLDLGPGGVDLINDTGVKKIRYPRLYGAFNKFLVVSRRSDGQFVETLKNILSPYELAMCASSKDENAIVKYFIEARSMELEEALDHISNKLHIGDKDLIKYLKNNNHFKAVKMVS